MSEEALPSRDAACHPSFQMSAHTRAERGCNHHEDRLMRAEALSHGAITIPSCPKRPGPVGLCEWRNIVGTNIMVRDVG